MNWRTSTISATAIVAGALAAPGHTFAAGFAIKEQSATALGNAFAGAAVEAEDASFMYFNPATVGRLDGYNTTVSFSYISPTSEFDNAVGSAADTTPLGGTAAAHDVGAGGLLPTIHGTAQLDDQWRIGLGVSVPYALETEYERDWVGRYHGVQSSVTGVNVNPVVAYNPVPWLSVAGGIQVQYLDARLTNAVDFATISGAAPAGTLDGFADVTGDDLAWGYNLGIIAEPMEGTRFGAAYRSAVDHRLKGDVDFDVPAPLVPTPIGLAFADGGVKADVETPATLNLGVSHDVNEDLTLMAGATWTEWSSFEEVRIEFDSGLLPDNVTEENWDNQWFLAAGATWRASENLSLRFGAAFDQKSMKERFRTPRIPDNDRYWLSVGASWEPTEGVSLSFGYTHIFVEDSDVRLTAADVGNLTRGNLSASYEGDVDIVAIGASVRF